MSWVSEDEKFALLGPNIEVAERLNSPSLPPGFSVFQDNFVLPDHWKEWLGSQRVEAVESCSTFLAVKMQASYPGVSDGDDQKLRVAVGHWYFGILLTGRFLNLDDPFFIAGSRYKGDVDVRQFEVLHPTGRGIIEHYPVLETEHIERAASIARTLESLSAAGGASNWRLFRCLAIYRDGRSKNDVLDRLHQFVRCIEGLIASGQGEGEKKFKSRTELFIGPKHHDFMGQLYQLRGHIEHLHENQHLETFDRDVRIEIATKEAVSEHIARNCLLRILENSELQRHFGNVDTLRAFWQLEKDRQVAAWGRPIDPFEVMNSFSFDHVSDHDLGRPS
jgi:hypothetical protein